jgi:tol-pal system protein YbgF
MLMAGSSLAANTVTSQQTQEYADRSVYLPAPPETETLRKIGDLQNQLQSFESRLARIESFLQNQVTLDLLKEIELMKAEVSRLHGQAEMQTHQMESLGKRQTDLYTDLDKRLEDLKKQAKNNSLLPPSTQVAAPPLALVASTRVSSTQSAPASVKPEPAPKVPDPPRQAEDPMAGPRAYEAALNQFKAGNYTAAITEFKSFLHSYPDNSLASNAQYWIGYSYYALKDYKTAIAHQRKLVSDYPQSAKIPDALLNIANSQAALDGDETAIKTLEDIVSRYPGTNAAKIAARRLAALK